MVVTLTTAKTHVSPRHGSSSTPATAPNSSCSPTKPDSRWPRQRSNTRPPTTVAGDMTSSPLSLRTPIDRFDRVHHPLLDMTAEHWRRRRSARPRPARRRSARLFAAARRLVPLRPVPCDHLHDTTTRYDSVEKLLSFLLPARLSRLRHGEARRDPAAPRFNPHPAPERPAAGATVHHLPVRP
jgi:hypothetical protein